MVLTLPLEMSDEIETILLICIALTYRNCYVLPNQVSIYLPDKPSDSRLEYY